MEASTGPLLRWFDQDVSALADAWDVPVLEVWPTVTSTNDRAADLARDGAPPWSVVVAIEQTAGRGRRGRGWVSNAGAGLWMSIVVDAEPGGFALPLTVGTCVAESVDRVVPTLLSRVKWPNDVVIEGRKVAGILVERRGGRVIVGIGVNLERPDEPMEGALEPVGLTEVAGATLDPRVGSELCGAIVASVRSALTRNRDSGAPIEAFRSRDALLDVTVVSETQGIGVARGVDDDGALWLERPDGTRVRIVSGSVRPVAP